MNNGKFESNIKSLLKAFVKLKIVPIEEETATQRYYDMINAKSIKSQYYNTGLAHTIDKYLGNDFGRRKSKKKSGSKRKNKSKRSKRKARM